jgi:hypothetical protein
MADWSKRIEEEVEELRGLRDDLRVQVHLAKMEAQERWEKAEEDWESLEGKLRQLAADSREELHEIGEAARLLASQIRESYRHIRERL